MTLNPADYPVLQAVDDVWNANLNNAQGKCNIYLFQVAKELGVTMSENMQANQIVDYLMSPQSGWQNLGKNPWRAVELANQGYFVVAGKKELGTNGHVAVVVPSDATISSDYGPYGSWGQLNGVGKRHATLSSAWVAGPKWKDPAVVKKHGGVPGDPPPLDEVLYFARQLDPKHQPRVKSER